MTIELIPYTPDWSQGVREFNARMNAAGVRWGWYVDPQDHWIPQREPGQRVWREHFLAVEDGRVVRGACALKPQEFLVRGEPHIVADWQGPITEGFIDARYVPLALRMIREMLKRYPLLYSWGHGAEGEAMLRMLRSMGWLLHETPACVRILRPARFLRLNQQLRGNWWRRLALDALALTGAGPLAITALHALLSTRSKPGSARAAVVQDFRDFGDETWARHAGHYTMIAARDARTMGILVPAGGWPKAIALRITGAEGDLGWALVLDTQMSSDRRFGDLRVGSIIDCLAAPSHAGEVIDCAFRFLRDRGVDLVFSNHSHPAWIAAFSASGFVILQRRRTFAASPQLAKLLEPFAETRLGIYLTNMDGHGPMVL
jgi:hypothetical protein